MSINTLESITPDKDEIFDKFENTDAELAVIGCLLWDNRSYEKIADFLTEDHFTNQDNKKIFSTIKQLLDKNILVSPITLKNYLEENNENSMDNYTYLNQQIKFKKSTPKYQP